MDNCVFVFLSFLVFSDIVFSDIFCFSNLQFCDSLVNKIINCFELDFWLYLIFLSEILLQALFFQQLWVFFSVTWLGGKRGSCLIKGLSKQALPFVVLKRRGKDIQYM